MAGILMCPGCGKELIEEMHLPCKLYCTKCIVNAQNGAEFECTVCEKPHLVPPQGFETFLFDNLTRLHLNLLHINKKIVESKDLTRISIDSVKSHFFNRREKINNEIDILEIKIELLKESLNDLKYNESTLIESLQKNELIKNLEKSKAEIENCLKKIDKIEIKSANLISNAKK